MGILKRTSPWEHSYQTMWRREQKFLSDYRTTRPDMLCSLLEERVPSGLTETLHQAFFRAFSLLFEKGEGIVRWAGRQQRREEAYQVRRFAADLREDRRSLRAFSKAADRAGQGSVVQAGVQGVGLGLLGIGLPDIPLFTLTLLKTIRETAVSFGFAGTETDEQVWILRLIEASLSSGTELEERNRMLNQFIQEAPGRIHRYWSSRCGKRRTCFPSPCCTGNLFRGFPWWELWEAHGMRFACGVSNDMPRSNTAAAF